MLLARSIIFQPKRLPANYIYQCEHPLKEYFFDFIIDSLPYKINLVHVKSKNQRGIVFYLHGTLNHIQYHLPKANVFIENGYDVVMMDYPTYGKSKGRLTEDLLYKVVEKTFFKSLEIIDFNEKVVLSGRSLGTALASNLATKISAEQLILISPYYNMPDLFQHKVKLFPFKRLKFKLENNQYIPDVKCETFIFHGKRDKLIPIRLAKKLIPLLKSPQHFIEIEEADHFNIHETDIFKKKIKKILS